MADYHTISQASEIEVEIKKSRFIGFARPTENELAVKAFLDEIRQRHPQARHHVYAWRVGGFFNQQVLQRYSDDGEPAGTGGLPILKKIDALELTQVSVVVVRYFGGILLGTGGLSRAYAQSADLAIQEAKPVLMRELSTFAIQLSYSLYELVKNKVHEAGMYLYDEVFAAEVSCSVACLPSQVLELQTLLQELASGPIEMEDSGAKFIAAPLILKEGNEESEKD